MRNSTQLNLFFTTDRVIVALKRLEWIYAGFWGKSWTPLSPQQRSFNLKEKAKGIVEHDRVLHNDEKFRLERFRFQNF